MATKTDLDREYWAAQRAERALRDYRKYLFYRRHAWMRFIPFGAAREIWAYGVWSQSFTCAQHYMRFIEALRSHSDHPFMEPVELVTRRALVTRPKQRRVGKRGGKR